MDALGLQKEDYEKVRRILIDAKASLNCEIGLAGSLAQRAISPHVVKLLHGQRLNDIDLLLIGATNVPPETPELRKRFRVVEVLHERGWYYGLKHRSTGMWVDVFTAPFPLHTKTVSFDGETYKATSLESQILYLAHDILRRSAGCFPIRSKWIKKLSKLNGLLEIDRDVIQEEFTTHARHFSSVLRNPDNLSSSADAYIWLAASQKPTSYLSEKLFMIWWRLFLRKTKT